MYKVSIIVISHNTKKDFTKTLSSILNQQFKQFELIVVDGKSSDGTIDEIKKNKNKINKIIIEKDKGIYDAMNKGIRISNSEWIIFMNSGDIFFNNKTLSSINFDKYNNKHILYGDTVVDKVRYKYLIKAIHPLKNFIVMPFSHQSCFAKTEELKKNLFSLKYKSSSDFNFIYSCKIKKKNFYYLKKIISITKIGGISDKFRSRVIDENINIIQNYDNKFNLIRLKFIKLNIYLKKLIKKILGKKIFEYFLRIKYRNRLIK
jgi:glycosyltransferase involved in cell wall biosynthesis